MGSTSDQSYYWQEKHLAEQLWLHYFNSILFQKGLITETQHNRINTMIRSRKMEITQIKKRNYLLEKKN